MTLRERIEKRLEATRDCKFKDAFILKGWTCVPIKTFAKELAQELERLK